MIRFREQASGLAGYYEKWHRIWHRLFMIVESHFNRVFSEKYNPFYYLGALTVFTLLVLVVTGIYMFIYYSPSVDTVYESVKYVNDEAFLGSLTRSVHQYASDLMIVLCILHMVRVFVQDKYRKYRWIAWVSGVVMLFATLVEGVIGHIMTWNTRSQFIVTQTAELIAALRVFGDDLPRAFAAESLLSIWIMWILLALHILIPIAFIFLIYIHLSRISRSRFLPPRPLMIATVAFLVIFSLLFPVKMLEKADLFMIPAVEEVDWFYLFMTPFIEDMSPYVVWGGTTVIFFFFVGVPWYRKSLKVDVADLELDKCTGCSACAKDCPYEAIFMRPRTDGLPYKMESKIIESRCAGCGICVGSCDFGGMNLTDLRLLTLESEMDTLLQTKLPDGSAPYLGIFCQNSLTDPKFFDLKKSTLVDEPRLRIISAPCAGLVGPSFVRKALEKGAGGVVVAACRTNDCHYREGNIWLKDRLQGKRVPKLHLKEETRPVVALSFSSVESDAFLQQTKGLIDSWQGKELQPHKRGQYQTVTARQKGVSALVLAGVFSIFLFFYFWGVVDPWKQGPLPLKDTGMLRINYFHLSDVVSCGTENYQEGIEKVREQVNQMTRKDNVSAQGQTQEVSSNLVSAILCPRERVPVQLKVMLNDKSLLDKKFNPSGISNDGLTYVSHNLKIPVGSHRLSINMVDSASPSRQQGIDFVKEIHVKDKQIVFIDFNEKLGKFYIREN